MYSVWGVPVLIGISLIGNSFIFTLPSLEGVAERALRGVSQRQCEIEDRDVLLTQRALGDVHAPVEQVGHRRDAGHGHEALHEGGPGHSRRPGQLLQMPCPARIAHAPAAVMPPDTTDWAFANLRMSENGSVAIPYYRTINADFHVFTVRKTSRIITLEQHPVQDPHNAHGRANRAFGRNAERIALKLLRLASWMRGVTPPAHPQT
jgi:hypothetical protein